MNLKQAFYFNTKGEKIVLTNYYVDEQFKVYRIYKNEKIREKTPFVTSRGYHEHILFLNKEQNGTHILHHRLVCSMSNENHIGTFEVVDHIDGNKLNNHPSNLRFVSQKENLSNVSTEAKQRQIESCRKNGSKQKGTKKSKETKHKMSETKIDKNPNHFIHYNSMKKRYVVRFPRTFNVPQKSFKTLEEALNHREGIKSQPL